MSYLDVADRIWPLTRRVMGLHTLAYRATGGRIGHRLPGMSGPMLLLDHVGAKSGVKRTTPLLYFRDGDDVAIVASKGGFPKHPAWFHNLLANPETTVQIGSERRPVRARVANPEERKRLWPRAVETYSGYAGYQARSKGREIPLVILERRR
jgi:deazaflavin-dependent oxidoreductase (nitroreductase family)